MKTKTVKPLTIRVTIGGGSCPLPIFEEEHFLVGGDTISINLPDQPVVFTRGANENVPLRLKFRGRWYEIGKEIREP